jgi:GcrA cell cycle regulator
MTGYEGFTWLPRPRWESPWTDERIAHLTARWSQGVSARQISAELGISRSSVLGKIRRLGIVDLSPYGGMRGVRPAAKEKTPAAGREPENSPAATPAPIERARPAWVINAKPYADDPLADADIPFAQRRSFMELNCRTCRWPVGDPASSSFFFCGAKPLFAGPYCAAHWARAGRPAKQTARRAPGACVRRTMLEPRSIDTCIEPGGEAAAEPQSAEETR